MSKVRSFLNNFDSECIVKIIGKDGNVICEGNVEIVLKELQADYTIIGESVILDNDCVKIYVK